MSADSDTFDYWVDGPGAALLARKRSMTPLRGRVVIRETFEDSRSLWTPRGNDRERLTHRGIVLAMGPPVQTAKGVDIPHGFAVGDVVGFHFEGTEKGRIANWEDGKPALWMAQREVDYVVEP